MRFSLQTPRTPALLLFAIIALVSFDALRTAFADPPIQRPPKNDEVLWLRANGHSFDTVEAGNGFDDLGAFRDIVGDARIVALGECTHGSREVFQMKHRLVEFLATEMGFNIFSIEANMPEAYEVGEYVNGDDSDPKSRIGGMYFWTWNTEEVLDMVEWMRGFNHAEQGKIEFTGFDMQTPDVAMDKVVELLEKADSEYAADVKRTYRSIKDMSGGGSDFGVATWRFPVEQALGKKVRYTGSIKTESLTGGWAGLWWRVDGENGVLAFDNMQARGPFGTTDWIEYEIELDVAADATNINFGVLMPGSGTAWFDDLRIELDGERFVHEDFDLGFEKKDFSGYYVSNNDVYRARLDNTDPVTGKQSLQLTHIAKKEEPADVDTVGEAERVLALLEENRDELMSHAPGRDVDWAIQNARVVLQCMQMRTGRSAFNIRDKSMAENIAWTLDQNPHSRIIVWAHNGHIARADGWMGSHLAERFGNDYVSIGFTTAQGKYYAWSEKSLGSHDLAEPPEGSVESFFYETGAPRLVVDLREVEPMGPSSWLAETRLSRHIGAMKAQGRAQFLPHKVAELYDALVYIRDTTAARQLDTPPGRR